MVSFLVFVVVLVSELRLLRLFWEEKIIREHQKKIFSIFFFIFSATVVISFSKKPIFVWFILFGVNFLSYFVPVLIKKRRKDDFEQKAIELVDVMTASIKSGRSFRETIKRIQIESKGTIFYFQEIFQAISLEQTPERISSDAQVQRFYIELLQISKSQHRIADRLVSLRRTMKTERWFKLKIKQVLLQSRAQSFIMTILYVALMGYILGSYGVGRNLDLILASVGLYLSGTIWIWKMGRSYQWKA